MAKDPYKLLQEKEMDVARIRREIESLRVVIPLLDDDSRQAQTEEQLLAAIGDQGNSEPGNGQPGNGQPGNEEDGGLGESHSSTRFWSFGRKKEARP
jgi:hypothetical protein